ncbi:MAG: nucleotidyltransferase family protein, partial [Solirubrobacterales bacterium]|nr:nucleotidyltransferase family protein [Solirubrobacterales bacterium]
MQTAESFQSLCETLKVAVAALRDAHIPFALGGSLAAWARGGPEPTHDLDLMVKPGDAEAALRALGNAGMRPERPPEEWLFKAWNGDVMVDLIFHPSGLEMTDEVLARADTIPLMSVATPVMALEDVLTTKLFALDEHSLDYTHLVAIARSVREQIDWAQLRARTTGSLYAPAFFSLVEALEIAPSPRAAVRAAPH